MDRSMLRTFLYPGRARAARLAAVAAMAGIVGIAIAMVLGQLADPPRAPGAEPHGAVSGRGAAATADEIRVIGLQPAAGIRARPELVVQTGHSSEIWSLKFSPDGRILATGSDGETVIIWDVQTGLMLRAISVHYGKPPMAFSPSGNLLATGAIGAVVLWNPYTGEKVRTLELPDGHIWSMEFSPDGKSFAVGSADGLLHPSVTCRDVETGRKLYALTGRSRGLPMVAFHPDGKLMAIGLGDITIVDARTGENVRTLDIGREDEKDGVIMLAFSRSGRSVAAMSGGNRKLGVWDAKTGEKEITFKIPIDHRVYSSVSGSGHGGGAAANQSAEAGGSEEGGSKGSASVLWDAAVGQKIIKLDGGRGGLKLAAFSPNDTLIATGFGRESATIWDERSGRVLHDLIGHTGEITAIQFSPDSRRVATASEDCSAIIWDAETGERLRTLASHVSCVESVAFDQDDQHFAVGLADGAAVLWDVGLRVRIGLLNPKQAAASWPALAGGWRRLEDLKRGGFAGTGGMAVAAVTPDRQRVAIGSRDGSISIQDLKSGRGIIKIPGHQVSVQDLAFSADGEKLVSCVSDEPPIIWDVRSGRKIRELGGKRGFVTSAAFSQDGRFVLAGFFDGTCGLWDTAAGTRLPTLVDIDAGKDWLVFAPDGRYDGSDGGRRLAAFRVGPSEVVVGGETAKEFYTPGLLDQVLGHALKTGGAPARK
jgi:WD40 repeat protein